MTQHTWIPMASVMRFDKRVETCRLCGLNRLELKQTGYFAFYFDAALVKVGKHGPSCERVRSGKPFKPGRRKK